MRSSRLIAMLFGLVVIAALVGLRASDPFMVRTVRELGFDQFQRLEPRPAGDLPVRVVDIDEASLSALGQWPWPRDVLARLVERLDALGAAAIAFDIAFAEPDRLSPARLADTDEIKSALGAAASGLGALRDNDQVFAAALEGRPTVLAFGVTDATGVALPRPKAGFAFTGERTSEALPAFDRVTPIVPALEVAAAGLGSMSLTPGLSSGIVRRIPLMLRDAESIYPALVLEALRVAQGTSTYIVRGAHDVAGIVEDVRVGDFTVPTTRAGELWIYYRHDRPDLYVPAHVVLAGGDDQALAGRIAGHVVFVGTSAVGLLDVRVSALGETVPGVSVHAQAAEQIISGVYLSRPDWADGLEFIAIAATGMLLVASAMLLGPLPSLAVGGAVAAGTLTGAWLAFSRAGLLIDATFPVAAAISCHFSMIAYRFLVADRDARFVRRAFSRYVSPSVLAQLQKDPSRLKLGGELRDLTVMFADVRGFTPISEALAPSDLVTFLNRLLGELSARVMERDGTIDKYIGDALMAFWNAPIEVPGHRAKACRAALDMREAMGELNRADAFGFAARGLGRVEIGIGLNTGTALVGNLGSETRFDYSCIGDAVNVTSRVESACKEVGFDIVVTAGVAAGAEGLAFLSAGAIALKGKSAPEPIFILVGDEAVAGSGAFRALKAAHDRLIERLAAGAKVRITRELNDVTRTAEAVSPDLRRFYDRLAGRRGDFAAPG